MDLEDLRKNNCTIIKMIYFYNKNVEVLRYRTITIVIQ